MKALTRRVRRIEQRTFTPENEQLRKVLVEIKERRRRYLEEQGLPFEERESLPLVLPDGRCPNLIDVLRHARFGAIKKSANT
jgi:hypothetical protein